MKQSQFLKLSMKQCKQLTDTNSLNKVTGRLASLLFCEMLCSQYLLLFVLTKQDAPV